MPAFENKKSAVKITAKCKGGLNVFCEVVFIMTLYKIFIP